MVGLNKTYKYSFATIVFVCILLFSTIDVMAQKNLVFDEAGLLTQEQISLLEEEANELSNIYNMDIVITTTNDAEGKSAREYADDYYDYGGFGVGADYDGILFLIDMDNREVYISTTGIGIRYLTDERIERVLDKVFESGLVDGDYFGASKGFLGGIRTYLESGIPSDQYSEPEDIRVPNNLTIFDILVGLVGGTTTGGIFYGVTKSRYKLRNPGNPFSYRNNSIVNIASIEDKLIDSFVTHRIIPKPTNTNRSSSGRSTTHRSSSGRSHGGGGRKF